MNKIKCIAIVIAFTLLTGCSAVPKESFEDRFDKKYLEIENYASSGKITVYSNKTKNSYNFIQAYKKPDMYILEYPDDNMKMLFSEGKVFIAHSKNNKKTSFKDIKEEYMHIFVDNFLKNYFSCQSGEYLYEKSGKNLILKCDVTTQSGDNLVELLIIDEKNLIPIHLDVLRKGGEKVFEIDFNKFEFVKKFKDDIFDIEGKTNENLERSKS